VAHGKRYRAVRELVKEGIRYPIDEAVGLVKQSATAKFDEFVDVAFRLGVDPKQADHMVRGALSLPHGSGKTVRVVVFAEGDAAREALDAGADVVGADDLINKINDGWVEFDKAIAVRNMMAKVGRLGRVLGPRGLMPNPKTGSVVGPEQVAQAVREVKGGRIDFKVDKAGIVHVSVGKASMETSQIKDNLLARSTDRPAQAVNREGHLRQERRAQHHHGPRGPHRSERDRAGRGRDEVRR